MQHFGACAIQREACEAVHPDPVNLARQGQGGGHRLELRHPDGATPLTRTGGFHQEREGLIQEEVARDPVQQHQFNQPQLKALFLHVEDQQAVAVVGDPASERLAVGERVVMDDQVGPPAADIHLDAISVRRCGQLSAGVAAMGNDLHQRLPPPRVRRSRKLKSMVRWMNRRLAAQSTFQDETPWTRGANSTGKRFTLRPIALADA